MEIKVQMAVNNDCYKKGGKMKPIGIFVHSTGANNPKLSRYVQPDDGILGKNPYNNDWNRPNMNPAKCVHAWIGKDKNGVARIYQTLPWDMPGWHSGTGSKGHAQNANNNGYIGFEICEDDLKDADYLNETYNLAVELCAYLVKKYNTISIDNIIGHYEGWERGIASNHSDPKHWFSKHGKSMAGFRADVRKLVEKKEDVKSVPTGLIRVRKSWADAGSQIGAYQNLQNAKDIVDKNPTYKAFDENGKVVYEVTKEQPKPAPQPIAKKINIVKDIAGYYTAADAKSGKNKRTTVKKGEYFVFTESGGMVNVSKSANVAGSWVNPSDNKVVVTPKPAPKPQTTQPKGDLSTTSIVTYLNSIGVNSSFSHRKTLAKQHGIKGYLGLAWQNTKLLELLRKGNKPVEFKVGHIVKVKETAKKYATGQNIASFVLGNKYKIIQVEKDRVLLDKIFSWVLKSDIE